MKLRLALVIMLSPVYFFSQAQKIQYGLTGALNLNSISGTGMSPKYQAGFEAGAFALIPIHKRFSLQPEILYNYLQVSRVDNFTTYYNEGGNSSSRKNFNLAYASIPVLINYRVTDLLTINAGPQISFLVYGNENLLFHGQAFKNSDFGIRGGVQMTISPQFNLFASYYNGINNVNAIDNRYQWKNRQIQIGMNILVFSDKKK